MSENCDAAHDDPDGPAGPLMLTPRRPEEVPHGREMSTLLDDFHHVYWQMLEQRRGFADPCRRTRRDHGLLSDDDHRRIVELAASAGAAEQMLRAKHVQRTSDQQETDRG